MSRLEFTPEDFRTYNGFETIADLANSILPEIRAAWLAELKSTATVVFGRQTLVGLTWGPEQDEIDTHRAYLIGVEEIAKDEDESLSWEDMMALAKKYYEQTAENDPWRKKLRKIAEGASNWKGAPLMPPKGWTDSLKHKESPVATAEELNNNFEEIAKKPCEHEPVRDLSVPEPRSWEKNWSCKHCGAKLKAKWEVAE